MLKKAFISRASILYVWILSHFNKLFVWILSKIGDFFVWILSFLSELFVWILSKYALHSIRKTPQLSPSKTHKKQRSNLRDSTSLNILRNVRHPEEVPLDDRRLCRPLGSRRNARASCRVQPCFL